MILAADIGTSFFKSALWGLDGRRLASAQVPLPGLGQAAADGRHAGEAETDAALWLRAFEQCCLLLGQGIPGGLLQVRAIVISGNGPTLVPVLGEPGESGEGLSLPAAPARLWLDRRAAKEAAVVSDLSGGFVDAAFFLPKALNIKNEDAVLYEKTRVFLGASEYLACALCGQARAVFPALGFERWFWNAGILDALGLDAGKFPPFINAGDAFGELPAQVARHLGFSQGIPVVAGGPDFFAAIVGSGARGPGQACDRAGTSEGINLCTESRINDWRLLSYAHPVKPFWNLSGVISTTGRAVQWAAQMLACDGAGGLADFYRLAESSKPGAGGALFLPHLAGERSPYWNPNARGIWRNLSLSSGREEAARSVLEGIAFAMRDVICAMEEAGGALTELRVTGAASAAGLLNQIKADVTGKSVFSLEHKDAELAGLAAIGAAALGECSSFTEAAGLFVGLEKEFLPRPEFAELYGELFAQYRETYRLLN